MQYLYHILLHQKILFLKSTIFHEYNIEEGHPSRHCKLPYQGSPGSGRLIIMKMSNDPVLMWTGGLTGTETLHIISYIQVCILI